MVALLPPAHPSTVPSSVAAPIRHEGMIDVDPYPYLPGNPKKRCRYGLLGPVTLRGNHSEPYGRVVTFAATRRCATTGSRARALARRSFETSETVTPSASARPATTTPSGSTIMLRAQ